MGPVFDPEKNAANLAKHGVSLAEGDGVLLDPLAIINSLGAVMVVVWTDRDDDVRIISVRRAEPKERRQYEAGV